MTTQQFPLHVNNNRRPAAVDPAGYYDDEDDRDHPLHEPEFVIHAVDDDRRGPAPVPPPPHPVLPVQHHHQPPPQHEPDEDERNAARIQRLRRFVLLPQTILCGWGLIFGCMMIFYAVRPDMQPDPHFIWLMVTAGLIMLFTLLSLLLSHLGVYVYDRYPSLKDWLQS